MNQSLKAGTALRLLCLPLTLSILASCDRQPQVKKPPEGGQEIQQLLEATKSNPSLKPGSNLAGPPIHVDPYPPSAGMAHDEHAHHKMAKH